MTQGGYLNVGGTWVQAERIYVNKDGQWLPAREAYTKRSGVWRTFYELDETPSATPLISLELEETAYKSGEKTLNGRRIRVGVRLPTTVDDPDLQMIRVLTTYNGKAPTTQYGGYYTKAASSGYPNEPWSDFMYNSYGAHKDSTTYVHKVWPRNATERNELAAGRYYFTAWSLDRDGNWSEANATSILVPKANVDGTDKILKEGRFLATTSGSWSASTFTSGLLVQAVSPAASRGLWFYGGQIPQSIGKQGAATISSAKIRVTRDANDSGTAAADMYLFWHDYANPGDITGAGPTVHNTVKVGTLNKGETKWFDLPKAHMDALEARSLRGFGLAQKDPVKASWFPEDYSVVVGTNDTTRCGELHAVWKEAP